MVTTVSAYAQQLGFPDTDLLLQAACKWYVRLIEETREDKELFVGKVTPGNQTRWNHADISEFTDESHMHRTWQSCNKNSCEDTTTVEEIPLEREKTLAAFEEAKTYGLHPNFILQLYALSTQMHQQGYTFRFGKERVIDFSLYEAPHIIVENF